MLSRTCLRCKRASPPSTRGRGTGTASEKRGNTNLSSSQQSFFDVLCRDLGIEKWRNRKGAKWWQKPQRLAEEWLVPYRAKDYKGLVNEFLENKGLITRPVQLPEVGPKAVYALVAEVYCKRLGRRQVCRYVCSHVHVTGSCAAQR